MSSKDLAKKILAKIKTPEAAKALSPAEREVYLKALDTVHGPKEARAAEMGFGKDVYYHGSNNSFSEFKPSSEMHKYEPIDASYFTKDPEEAASFIRQGDDGAQIYPVKIAGNEVDAKKLKKESVESLKKSGKNIIKDIRPGLENHAAVVGPENIRSTNAAFDPRFKDSTDLLAANSDAPNLRDFVKKTLGDKSQQAKAEAAVAKFLASQEQSGSEDPSFFDRAANTAKQYAAAGLETASPVLSAIDTVTARPLRAAADKLTGGNKGWQSESFGDAVRNLQDKFIPEAYQDRDAAENIGTVADFLSPGIPVVKPVAGVAKVAGGAAGKIASRMKPELGRVVVQESAPTRAGSVTVKPTLQELVEQRNQAERFHKSQQILRQRELQAQATEKVQSEFEQGRKAAQQKLVDSAREQEDLLRLLAEQIKPGSGL